MPTAPPQDINDARASGTRLNDLIGAARAQGTTAVQDEAAREVIAERAIELLDELGTRFDDPTITPEEATALVADILQDGPLTTLAIGHQLHAHRIGSRIMQLRFPKGTKGNRATLTSLVKGRVRELEQADRDAAAREAGRSHGIHLPGLDLPKAVRMPAGWRIDAGGVEEIAVTKDGDIRAFRFLSRPVVVVGRGYGEFRSSTEDVAATSSLDHYSVLAWPVAGKPNAWVRHVVRDDVLGSRSGVAKLRRHGAPFTEANGASVVRYLSDFTEANAAALPRVAVCRRLGWHGKSFLLGEQTITRADQDQPGVGLDMPENMGRIARAITTEGTWEGWLDVIRKQVLHRPLALAGIYASCAAPLVSILRAPGFTVDWSDDSSAGKSTTHYVAASVWGRPSEEGGFIFSWRTSPAWIGNTLGFLHNLPLLLDDTSKVEDHRMLTGLIYDVAGGLEKGRGQADGGAQKQATWNTILLSNGEAPLTSYVTKTGAVARVLTLKGSPFGRAEKGSEQESANAADADDTQAGLLDHHGHLGQRLIRWLVDHPEMWPGIRDFHRRRKQAWRDAASRHGKIAMRLGANVAVLETAARVVHHHLGVPLPTDEYAVWDVLMQAICHGGQESDRPGAALADLYSWAVANNERFDPSSKARGERAGAWLACAPNREVEPSQGIWHELGVRPQIVRNLLAEWGYEPNNILQVWQDRGWTPRGARRLGVARPFCGAKAHLLVLSRTAIDGVMAGDQDESPAGDEGP